MWLWSKHDDFNFHQRRYTREQFGDLFTPFLREPRARARDSSPHPTPSKKEPRAQARDASPTPDINPPTSGVVLQQLVLSYYQAFSLPLIAGARQLAKLRAALTGHAPKEPQVRPLPAPINWALTKAFEVEKHCLPHARVPWGTSVISVHRRAG
jgi:hypothetical protein